MSRKTGDRPAQHHFFILGLWPLSASRPGHTLTWRFSLENTQTGERIGFSSLAELTAYLETWLQHSAGGATPINSSEDVDSR